QSVVQQTFQSRQHYVYVNGHPMPIHLETVGDESPIDDFENRRFYVQLFEMKLLGYILDEDEFEVIPAVNRLSLTEKISTESRTRRPRNVTYDVNFNANSVNTYSLVGEFDTTFFDITNQTNITTLVIELNNNVVTLPFEVTGGDTIEFTITRDDSLDSSFILN